MSARMRHLKCPSSQYPVLKVHACGWFPVATGPRGKEIYCQTGGAPWAGIAHSIFCSQMNRSLSRITEVKTEALASDIGDDQLFYVY